MIPGMRALQIRDLPDDIHAALRARAKRQGRSLAQQALAELRALPELEARERRLELIERLVARAAAQRPSLPDPVELVREDRDR